MSAAAKTQAVAVEVAVDSLAGARAAEQAGADRIELCCDLGAGGLTPSLGLLQAVKAAVRIPVVAMLRPRAGDFLFDDGEFAVLLADLAALRAAGADEFVTGMLTEDGDLDRARMGAVVRAALPAPVACHRAFDCVREPAAALETLIGLGVRRVLTSGQAPTALDGAAAIAALVAAAQGLITVLAGGAVRAAQARELLRRTRVRELHLSASAFLPSAMRHRAAAFRHLAAAGTDAWAVRRTDAAEVAALVAAVRPPAPPALDRPG